MKPSTQIISASLGNNTLESLHIGDKLLWQDDPRFRTLKGTVIPSFSLDIYVVANLLKNYYNQYDNYLIPTKEVRDSQENVERTFEFTFPAQLAQMPTNHSDGFKGKSFLKTIDEFPVLTKQTSYYYFFAGCSNLEKINLDNLDTSNATTLEGMFQTCSKLKEVDFSGLDTSKVTHLGSMFYNAYELEKVDLSGCDLSLVNNLAYMFYDNRNLKYVDLSGLGNRRYSYSCNASSFSKGNLFYQNGLPASLSYDLETRWFIFRNMNLNAFQGIWNSIISYVTPDNGFSRFYLHLDVSGLNLEIPNLQYYLPHVLNRQVKTLIARNCRFSAATAIGQCFSNTATYIDFSGAYIPAVRNIANIFKGCVKAICINLRDIDFSNVQVFTNMFYGCEALTKIRFTTLDLSSATAVTNMFYNCTSLSEIEGEITGIKLDLNLADCPLTRNSALAFFNGLEETDEERTINLSSSTMDLLSDSDIAIATSKGWSVIRWLSPDEASPVPNVPDYT